MTSPEEEHVCDYLITITGNVQSLELRLFLRFVTSASCALPQRLKSPKTVLVDLFVAHTCDFNLELSTAYTNYDDFYGDLKSILISTSEDFLWRMDALLSSCQA